MSTTRQRVALVVDGYTRFCLTVIVALLSVLIVGLWADYVPVTGNAVAAESFLDASAQRKAILEAQGLANRNLEKLVKLLESGEAKVQVIKEAGKEDADAVSADKTAPK